MSDLLTRTACGLYVMPDGKPRGWPGFTWTQQVVDVEGDQENRDALSLIGVDLMNQVGQNTATGAFVEPLGVTFAALHPDDVTRVDHPALDFADPDVPGYLVDEDRQGHRWTVCGLLEGSWRTVHYEALADTPLVAYFRAWEWCRDFHGGYLLLAAVHPGQVEALAGFGFADPWISDEQAMRVKARDEWRITT